MDSVQSGGPAAVSAGARLLRFPMLRILLALLAILIPSAAVYIPLNMFVHDKLARRAGALLLTVIVISAYRIYVRCIERRAATEIAWTNTLRELGAGVALGILLLSLTIGLLAALGAYRITGLNGWTVILAAVPASVLAAVLEEVIFRGVVFRILEHWLGTWTALALSAALFGALHLFNPGSGLISAACITMEAGIMLTAAYMLTRRLWFCIGIHCGWNYAEGGIFSTAVSGSTSNGLLQAKLTGPAWLTGGSFGPEASVVALAICTAAGLLLIFAAIRKGQIIRPSWSVRPLAEPAS